LTHGHILAWKEISVVGAATYRGHSIFLCCVDVYYYYYYYVQRHMYMAGLSVRALHSRLGQPYIITAI